MQLSLISVTPGVDGGLVYRRCLSLLMGNVVGGLLMTDDTYILELDPVGSTVRYEMMMLCTGSV